jgi:tetratricopeptide (TPR) repeat protein
VKVFFRISFIILLMALFPWETDAQDSSKTELYHLIEKGKKQIYNFQMEEALQTFDLIEKQYPDLPHGYFYVSYVNAIYYSQDMSNRNLDSLLQESIRLAIEKGERYKELYPETAEAYYYLGVSHGVLGIYHVLRSSYFKGYIHGRRAKNYLEDAVKIDSTYYDAYLGLGVFHYYVDLLPGVVKFFAGILGFHGDRAQGMKEIRLTAQRGQFFQMEGEFIYAAVRYFLEGDYYNSLNTFQKLHRAYPENPALTLLIGYHYRRHGQIRTAENYFSSVSESYTDKLPQITVMKIYNLGVCYFRLNDFPAAESYFNRLLDTSLRKSRYYQAAIAYYKGLLAGLNMRQKEADYYLGMIFKNEETQYWYYISRMYIKYPFDSLMVEFTEADNDVYSLNYRESAIRVQELAEKLKDNPESFHNSYLPYLIMDLEARFAFQRGNIQQAKEIYESFVDNISQMNDEFQQAWIYIAYARVLREEKQWKKSSEMLDKAGATDDEYTRLMIERERYILKNLQKTDKT